jgi:hypothetical protein
MLALALALALCCVLERRCEPALGVPSEKRGADAYP